MSHQKPKTGECVTLRGMFLHITFYLSLLESFKTISYFGALGTKVNWSGQRSRSQLDHRGQISTLGGILTYLQNASTYFNEAYHNYLQGYGFKGQGHQQRFPKMQFSGGGMPIDGFPSKTICLIMITIDNQAIQGNKVAHWTWWINFTQAGHLYSIIWVRSTSAKSRGLD